MDELDSAIEKLIEYSKAKRSISWDELNGMLPSEILNSDKMETVLSELAKNNIQLEDDTALKATCSRARAPRQQKPPHQEASLRTATRGQSLLTTREEPPAQ